MAETVFELMKESAASSIPRYRQILVEMDSPALQGMLGHLRPALKPLKAQTLHFLAALEARQSDSYQLLTALETEDILMLHEGIQHCWNQITEAPEKQAIRQLYQLIAAHFFVYHVKS